MQNKFHVLVAPLNWGLGHATRCIPIIDQLLALHIKVSIASDGRALALLREHYPNLPSFELPSYGITYKGSNMVINMAKQLPRIAYAYFSEHRLIKELVNTHRFDAIISDNRFGCRNRKCTNVFITHQLAIQSPIPWISSIANRINYLLIAAFDECWVPDIPGEDSLAGDLSLGKIQSKRIGLLSRFKAEPVKKEWDIIAVLSGPEPQRSMLEEKLIAQLSKINKKALMVQGLPENQVQRSITQNLSIVSFLNAEQLNRAVLASELVIARSGYSTIMDLATLGKKTFFIPTPGQTEQEYLAERLYDQGICYYQTQANLDIEEVLRSTTQFQGFSIVDPQVHFLQKALQDLQNLGI